MTPTSPRAARARLAAAAVALVLGAAFPACRCAKSAVRAPPKSYTARAQILRMPGTDRRHPEMTVRHEAIDDFVDEFGFPVGMDAMEMSFPVDPPLSVQGLAVGDKVSFHFTVDWEKSDVQVDSIQKLPPETELHFGPARKKVGGERTP